MLIRTLGGWENPWQMLHLRRRKKYRLATPRDLASLQGHVEPAPPPTPEMVKVGRNEPCPCGSGRKYKRCCLNKESKT